MKRIQWVMTALLFGIVMNVPETHAQQIGITGGMNIASLTGGIYSLSKDGPVIGGFARCNLIHGIVLEPEVIYSMKGGNGYRNAPGPGTSELTLDYIEVPVLLSMKIFTLPVLPASFDVFAGPDFAFNVRARDKNLAGNPLQGYDNDISGSMRLFDFNIAVGCGPNFNVGSIPLGLELRYTFGTGRVFKSGAGNWNNNIWSVMARAGF